MSFRRRTDVQTTSCVYGVNDNLLLEEKKANKNGKTATECFWYFSQKVLNFTKSTHKKYSSTQLLFNIQSSL